MLGRLILPRLRIPLGSSIPKGNIGALDIGTGHDKPLLSSPNQLATSPDGDGGVYQAILPIIPKLEQNGIEYFHVYCADNILCRVPDLHMIGCAIDKKADCISKVIEKNNPYEKIGLVCIEDEKIKLYDHSKISKGLIGKRYPKFPEKLLLHAGYIGNQFFTLDFLKKACFEFDSLPSHQVRKRMPFWDPVYGKNIQPTIGVNGIKRKLFIFDSFVHANSSPIAHSELQVLSRPPNIHPISPERYFDRKQFSAVELNKFYEIGIEAVSQGKLAVITLAGGQSSRFGVYLPKGIIDVGTGLETENDSLLFLQASQISYIQQKAKGKITWLIMTSKSTDEKIREHLEIILKKTNLDWEQSIADQIPFRNFISLLASCNLQINFADISFHKYGDGGVYQAILPILPKLEESGIEYFHVYCVDNILCRVPDLHMIGCAIDKKADCISKVVEKKNPYEKFGLVYTEDGKIRVADHSKIPNELVGKRDPKFPEKLLLHAGYIGNQFFTLDFLKKACFEFDLALSSRATTNFMVWQVPREEEFSPLKNPNSAGVDCLSTCIRDFNSVNGDVIREMVKEFCKKE
uniref:UDP-N-acetylglucosamine diphosphorylase n=1 Tax=Meloidogyne hapla TaxID=6305 RepID=A0A1I8BVA3_MELHA